MKVKQHIDILDTTLRDGQQSPGAGMSFADNIAYAQYANELGIDILEAGFPAASSNDLEIVKTISSNMSAQGSNMIIAALCQLREQQVDCTMEALHASLAQNKARIHVYLPVDPKLMPVSLGKMAENKTFLVEEVYRLVKIAADAGFKVQFTPEGYSRMQQNFDFTTDIIRAAISAGASIINSPDTIGGASRWQGEQYFVKHMRRHADMMTKAFPDTQITWSAHCHNDLGLALENTLNAVYSGPARQIEGCINGVGERAGNVALEQCIVNIGQFGGQASKKYDFYTNANLMNLKKTSDFIAEKMLPRQPHSPIVGSNSARHSSGGHTNAILKQPLVYQAIDPKVVGEKISFIFGPLSGSSHAKQIIEMHGFKCDHKEKAEIAQAIKDMYQGRRKGITDAELIMGYKRYRSPIQAKKISYAKDANNNTLIKIEGKFFSAENIEIEQVAENSALGLLDQAVKAYLPDIEIIDYSSNACDGNTASAKCQATIMVGIDDVNYIGKAVDSDINLAAMWAYIEALNQAYVNKQFCHDVHDNIE